MFIRRTIGRFGKDTPYKWLPKFQLYPQRAAIRMQLSAWPIARICSRWIFRTSERLEYRNFRIQNGMPLPRTPACHAMMWLSTSHWCPTDARGLMNDGAAAIYSQLSSHLACHPCSRPAALSEAFAGCPPSPPWPLLNHPLPPEMDSLP